MTGAADDVEVSVLTPVLNEAEHLRATYETMAAQRLDGAFELLFIDGGSGDGTREMVHALAQEDPRVRLLDNPAGRTPQALNIGLRASRGRFVARMDAHTLYPPDYLATGKRRLERGDVAHVSGPQLPRSGSGISGAVARALETPLGVGGASFRSGADGELEVDTGFTGMWRRETLEHQNGWDEGWPVNQDAELAARIRSEGGRLVCLPEMAAHYYPRASLRALARQYWRYGSYRAKTSRRHPQSMRRSHVLAPGVVLTLLVALGGPRVTRTAARLGLGVYALALVGTATRQATIAPRGEAAALPLVLATMHLAWGAGFLWGCVRFGVPAAALVALVRG